MHKFVNKFNWKNNKATPVSIKIFLNSLEQHGGWMELLKCDV